jgi:hypothetical protein
MRNVEFFPFLTYGSQPTSLASKTNPLGGIPLTCDTFDQPQSEAATAYASRPYERKLTMSGRKLVSIDLDEELVRKVDEIRGNARRGLAIDVLLTRALAMGDALVV